jgi:ATP-dependent DNA helicase RecG
VKEYGEGVDRMCKELETVGLRAPEYYSNSFMLHVIIHNSNIEKSVIEETKSDIDNKKSEIQHEKLSFDTINSEIKKYKYNEPTVNKFSEYIMKLTLIRLLVHRMLEKS